MINIFAFAQQPFAPVGTEWYYGVERLVPHAYDYVLLKSIDETIVDGKLCSIISNVKGGMICYDDMKGSVYAYQSNDTVYFYDNHAKFVPVHIWSAQQGDSWETLFGVTVHVEAVETISILGRTLKLQHVSYEAAEIGNNDRPSYPSIVIENIGDINYLYAFNVNLRGSCDEFTVRYSGLRV